MLRNPATSSAAGMTVRQNGKWSTFQLSGWNFEAHKGEISNSAETDSLSKEVGIPMPTMLFGNNYLKLSHESVLSFVFTAKDALCTVIKDDVPCKLSISDAWTESRQHQTRALKVYNPFDWTYTPNDYFGSVCSSKNAAFQRSTEHAIDYEHLKQPEQILFYSEVILFEDELADNGLAQLSVRLRVMPSCFFVLLRFFLRVENQLFRIIDCRIFHKFNSDLIIREVSTRESTDYAHIKASGDNEKLMNVSWLCEQLPVIESYVETINI